jgi:hypothetical protein
MILCIAVIGKILAVLAVGLAPMVFPCPPSVAGSDGIAYCQQVLLSSSSNSTLLLPAFEAYNFPGVLQCSSACQVSTPPQMYMLVAVSLVSFLYNLHVLFQYVRDSKPALAAKSQ